jgi:hypothetical protein
MRALVVNCSSPYYNLGAAKLADWFRVEGYDVETAAGDPGLFGYGFDVVALSVIFSWHAPVARDIALRLKGNADVLCGGPAMLALGKWWTRETGLVSTPGLDQRFERQRGRYRMTFASRGCPVNCWFCVVPRIEGTSFTLDEDFVPAPILCDNNLSALPIHFQDHILQRYRESNTALLDANSGFEPRTFDSDTYCRWREQLRGPWRFAYDTTSETEQVCRMMTVLRGERPRRKQVYVLIGNEPVAECYDRACKVIEWGGEPYCQPVMPLNALDRRDVMQRHDWTRQSLRDFARYFNRRIWRVAPLWEYSDREGETPPFVGLAPRKMA